MTVTYHHYEHTGSEPPLIILHVVGEQDIAAFKELVRRGSNLAPNLPASMKELADLVAHGRLLQDYKLQEVRENPIYGFPSHGDKEHAARLLQFTAEQIAAVDDTAGIIPVPAGARATRG